MLQSQAESSSASQSATLISVDGVLNGQLPDGSIVGHVAGDTLVPGEILMSAPGTQAQIQMADGRIIGLPGGANMSLEELASLDTVEQDIAEMGAPENGSEQEMPDVDDSGAPQGRTEQSRENGENGESGENGVEAVQGGTQNLGGFDSTPLLSPAVDFLSPEPVNNTISSSPGTVATQGSGISGGSSAANDSVATAGQAGSSASGVAAAFSSGLNSQPVVDNSGVAVNNSSNSTSNNSSNSSSGGNVVVDPGGSQVDDNSQPSQTAMSLQDDNATVRIGAQLQSQEGVLSNDTLPEGATVTSINGVNIAAQGQTVIQGKMGALTATASGEYSYSSTAVDIQDGMLGQWTFDSLNGSILADTGSDGQSDEDLTNSNGQLVAGLSGTALSVSGGQYASATVDNEVSLTSGDLESFSMALSFKAASGNDFSGRQVLFSNFNGNTGVVAYIDNGTLYVGGANSATTVAFTTFDLSSVDASDWHNIVLAYDADEGEIKGYFDGEAMTGSPGTLANFETQTEFTLTFGASTGSLVYHDGASSSTNGFNGLIDEARFYNRELEATDVVALAANQLDTTLEESFTYTVTDSGGNTATADLDIVLQENYNNLPVIEGQALTVAQAQSASSVTIPSLGLLGNVSDPDGDTVTLANIDGTVISSSGTTNISGQYGTLVVSADGTYSYVPLNSATAGGTDTFNVVVTDGSGQTSATLTVNVLANGFAANDSATVYESEADDALFLVFDSTGNRLMAVNSETGVGHKLYSGSHEFLDITVGTDNTVYGIVSGLIVSIDISNGTTTNVVNHGLNQVKGMTMAPDGTMYVVNGNGILHSVDMTSGTATSIGSVGGTPAGGMTWHNGEAYLYTTASGGKLVKVDVSDYQVTTVATNTGAMTGLASTNGKLVAVNEDGEMFEINPSTGAATELEDSLGQDVVGATQLAQGQAGGNILSNDTDASAVTQVMGTSGQNTAINSSGVTIVAGTFGNLHISADGSYTYHVDNSKPAFDDIDQGQTANDRFVYTATNDNNQTAQSVLTMFVSGATDVSVASAPAFNNALKTYIFDENNDTQSVAFNFDAGSNQKITGITISGHENGSLSSPTALTDAGSVTAEYDSWSWSATSGNNAGLQEFNGEGFTLSDVNDGLSGNLHIEVTVTSYNTDGTPADSWTTTVPLDARVLYLEDSILGDSGENTLTGTAQNELIIGGGGNDLLSGGDGMDVFGWQSGHVGTVNNPTVDTITDFALGSTGDVLQLADLIPESVGATNLDEYLSFNFDSGNTTIDVSTIAGGDTVQQIVLQGVDLSSAYGTTDATTLINNLTDDGNLMT